MKKVLFFCFLLISTITAHSQQFHCTDNVSLEEITESDYRLAYECREGNNFEWIDEGLKYDSIVTIFSEISLKSFGVQYGKAFKNDVNYNVYKPRILILRSRCGEESYIFQEMFEVSSRAFYINGASSDTLEMFGCGDFDNKQIYYACPDFDCDDHVWCRWYSFSNGKVYLAAEVEEINYDFAEYDLPPFFSDNRDAYYIAIWNNPNIDLGDNHKRFFRIRITNAIYASEN